VLLSQDRLTVFASEAGLSVTQFLSEDMRKADLAWTYIKGERLVTLVKEKGLPTKMQKLHEWYMVITKSVREMLVVKVTYEHYLGEDEIHIDFEELFQLYNQDALDKSLVSGYCL
jgi:hypothetical protein